MGIYSITNKLKEVAINTPMVQMVSFGDIMDYDNKATIKYPYVNIDCITSSIINYAQTYTFRIYVCDRNAPYIAYNKTEAIINTFLKNNEINAVRYTINYFSYDFKDLVHGVWADIQIEVPLVTECDTFEIIENESYVLMENGDLIRLNEG